MTGLLETLLAEGFHAGLHLGRWLPHLDDCLTVAVTEKRTREEIDGLTAALAKALAPVSRRGRHDHDRTVVLESR